MKRLTKKISLLNARQRKIAKQNSCDPATNKYKFDLKTMLNKPQCFDLNKTTEDQIFDKIIEGSSQDNNEYYIKHIPGTEIFIVKKGKK